MGLRIKTNTSVLKSQRSLEKNAQLLAESMEKLSSGRG